MIIPRARSAAMIDPSPDAAGIASVSDLFEVFAFPTVSTPSVSCDLPCVDTPYGGVGKSFRATLCLVAELGFGPAADHAEWLSSISRSPTVTPSRRRSACRRNLRIRSGRGDRVVCSLILLRGRRCRTVGYGRLPLFVGTGRCCAAETEMMPECSCDCCVEVGWG